MHRARHVTITPFQCVDAASISCRSTNCQYPPHMQYKKLAESLLFLDGACYQMKRNTWPLSLLQCMEWKWEVIAAMIDTCQKLLPLLLVALIIICFGVLLPLFYIYMFFLGWISTPLIHRVGWNGQNGRPSVLLSCCYHVRKYFNVNFYACVDWKTTFWLH